MKKLIPIALLALAATMCLGAQQTSQTQPSLGDVARQQRAQDQAAPAKKVWTNDDFPESPAPAPAATVAPDAAATPDGAKDATAKTAEGADKAKGDTDKSKESLTADDQTKVTAEWKTKIDAQKAKIADLQRDLDLTDRESKLFETKYYADAGNRLRDQKDFHDQEAGYHDKLTTLKDQISDAQAKLAELQDQAHKAGAGNVDK